jgi:hypothetical protein
MANLQVLAEKRAASQPGSTQLLDARDSSHSSGLFELFAKEVDDTLTWEAIPWLRSITKLPIYIKVSAASEEGRLVDYCSVSMHASMLISLRAVHTLSVSQPPKCANPWQW